jgi:uncharacterized protein (TIGR02246 family)
MKRVLPAVLLLGLLGSLPAVASPCEFTSADKQAIQAVVEKYRTSWLAGDAAGVQSTFSEDAVLLPHHGDPPVVGLKAIREYWWPAGASPTPITKLEITTEAFGGDCNIAFVRGHDSVSWTAEEGGKTVSYSNSGTYLNVMKKLADGSWRIWQHMWDDPANLVVKAEQ